MQTQTDKNQAKTHYDGELAVLDSTGDTKYHWSKNNPAEVAIAKSVFEKYREKGYTAAKMKKGGEAGKIIEEFDPDLKSVVFIPPMQAG